MEHKYAGRLCNVRLTSHQPAKTRESSRSGPQSRVNSRRPRKSTEAIHRRRWVNGVHERHQDNVVNQGRLTKIMFAKWSSRWLLIRSIHCWNLKDMYPSMSGETSLSSLRLFDIGRQSSMNFIAVWELVGFATDCSGKFEDDKLCVEKTVALGKTSTLTITTTWLCLHYG